MLARHS
jgi:hypothetical protein